MVDSSRSIRVLGLELAGAKNDKTALAVFEYFPHEEKTYLLHLYEGLGSRADLTADRVLLSILKESKGPHSVLCVNVPLQFPPCTQCELKSCVAKGECQAPAAQWALKQRGASYTPYTQRPVEIWLKKEVVARNALTLDVDETLGGARAPLTARMVHLLPRLKGFEVIESVPKLTTLLLGKAKRVPKNLLEDFRTLGKGARARADLLRALSPGLGLYLGPHDLTRATKSLSAFDALFCGVTGVLHVRGRCVKPPRGFPTRSGWIQYPQC